MEKQVKPAQQSFHDTQGEVYMDFNIGDFLDVKVDKERATLTLVARAVSGDPFNINFRTALENRLGKDAACRVLEESAHILMKSQILEMLRR